MTVTRHTADVIYSIFNGSILSVTNVSSGDSVPIDSHELLACYNATYNDPNWTYFGTEVLIQTASWALGPFGSVTDGAAQSLLALPLVFFQPKTLLFISILGSDAALSTCTFGNQTSRILLQKWTVILFAWMMVGTYLCSIGSLCWAIGRGSVPSTQFPLLDFSSRIASGKRSVQKTFSETALRGDFRKYLQDKRLFIGILRQHPAGTNDETDFSTSSTCLPVTQNDVDTEAMVTANSSCGEISQIEMREIFQDRREGATLLSQNEEGGQETSIGFSFHK